MELEAACCGYGFTLFILLGFILSSESIIANLSFLYCFKKREM